MTVRPSDDDVVIRIRDDAAPAAIWAAAVRHTAGQARILLGDIEKIVGPHERAVAAGGWPHPSRTYQIARIEMAGLSDTGRSLFGPGFGDA